MKKIVFLFGSCLSSPVLSVSIVGHPNAPYFGVSAGYGSTNWSKITTNDITLQSTLPEKSDDAGAVLGAFVGYNLGRHYGLEFNYKRFANSKIDFAYNDYRPDNAPFSMISHTQNFSLLFKLRVAVSQRIEMYSVMGGTYIIRRDTLTHKKGWGGVFGAGLNVGLTKRLVNGVEFDFATGRAGVNEVPAKSYLPFLTSINYRIAIFT